MSKLTTGQFFNWSSSFLSTPKFTYPPPSWTDTGIDMSKTSFQCDFKVGDWVRVLRNEASSTSPNNEGQYLVPYEGIKVFKLDRRDHTQVVVYLVGRSNSFIPIKDVEKIEECICATPVIKTCGCKCGYQQMLDGIEKEKTKKPNKLPDNVFASNGTFIPIQTGNWNMPLVDFETDAYIMPPGE